MTELAKLTREQLVEFLELEEQRKELDRQARQIKRKCDMLAEHFRAHLEAAGKDSLVRHKHRLSLIEGRVYVAWKDEFIKVAGPDKAAEIVENTPAPRRVVVQPV